MLVVFWGDLKLIGFSHSFALVILTEDWCVSLYVGRSVQAA
ncbi:hypothetical protein P3T31_002819 [Rhizobium sp. AN70]|nr:hypothetical protein [Rhizobium sp. AN70]